MESSSHSTLPSSNATRIELPQYIKLPTSSPLSPGCNLITDPTSLAPNKTRFDDNHSACAVYSSPARSYRCTYMDELPMQNLFTALFSPYYFAPLQGSNECLALPQTLTASWSSWSSWNPPVSSKSRSLSYVNSLTHLKLKSIIPIFVLILFNASPVNFILSILFSRSRWSRINSRSFFATTCACATFVCDLRKRSSSKMARDLL